MTFDQARVGMRVAHENCGAGVVISVADGIVTVEFDQKTYRGRPFFGRYDENWFRIYPNKLFRHPK